MFSLQSKGCLPSIWAGEGLIFALYTTYKINITLNAQKRLKACHANPYLSTMTVQFERMQSVLNIFHFGISNAQELRVPCVEVFLRPVRNEEEIVY